MSGISLLILNHSKVAKAQWFEKATIIIPLIHPLYRKPLMSGAPRLGTPGFSNFQETGSWHWYNRELTLIWVDIASYELKPHPLVVLRIKSNQLPTALFLMNTTKHHGDVKSQTPQKTCGVFFNGIWNWPVVFTLHDRMPTLRAHCWNAHTNLMVVVECYPPKGFCCQDNYCLVIRIGQLELVI